MNFYFHSIQEPINECLCVLMLFVQSFICYYPLFNFFISYCILHGLRFQHLWFCYYLNLQFFVFSVLFFFLMVFRRCDFLPFFSRTSIHHSFQMLFNRADSSLTYSSGLSTVVRPGTQRPPVNCCLPLVSCFLRYPTLCYFLFSYCFVYVCKKLSISAAQVPKFF